MYRMAMLLILLWTSVARAEVVNVEFNFTPYVGNPATDQVEAVSGTAKVFVNNVLLNEQEIRKDKLQVLFEDRQVQPSIWLPVRSLGPVLRKGKNSIRVEFAPEDPKLSYHALLRWASVTDQTTEKSEDGHYQATNMSGDGREDKETTGKVVLEREFRADFAADLPWHHYSPVTAVSEGDRKALALMVKKRADGFKPPFAAVYQLLEKTPGLSPAEVKKAKCLDQAYAAGIRVTAPSADQLEFAATGNPEIVVTRKGGSPLYPFEEKDFDRIKGDEAQMCAAVALSAAFPPRLVAVRSPSGSWEIAY